ncbi:BRO family protein [Gordonia alkanivorans]|uniref:Bro-N domain-containing protein n=1 Tax=Gordonia alkanivorans NBRC 16433 TaxID=1027371 RepID=F9VZ45_9ACTN|nr:BRO family protein [Gordonia alkanivorans]GAA13884.1 hypothetical protein GOALK_093_00720 [Gordonia alkanivorans NBRC 16433]
MQDQNTARIVPFNYEGTAVRTVIIDGEPWFVVSDVAKILGYRDASNAARLLRPHQQGYSEVSTPSGTQRMLVCSEGGVNRLIMRSNARHAEQVQDWFTDVVLPEIRKTGSFNAQPALQGPELVAAALVEANQMLEQRDARIYQLEQKVTGDAHKVSYVDTYVADADCLTFSTVASTLNLQESKLRELLIEKNWIYVQTDSRWSNTHGKKIERRRYSEKADKKRYFRRVESHEAPRFRGSEVMHTLKITPAGAEAISRLVAKERAA